MAFHTKGVRRLQACTLQLIESPINESSGKECEYEFFRNRHDYIWGPAVENGANGGHDLLAAVSIDAWKSADDNEEGEVLANVLLTAAWRP